MRKLDITDKLSFDQNPVLVVKGQEIEVNADTKSLLQLMALLKDGYGPEKVEATYNLLFPEASRKKIDKLHLLFTDFSTLVRAAVDLVSESGDDAGEQLATRTTT